MNQGPSNEFHNHYINSTETHENRNSYINIESETSDKKNTSKRNNMTLSSNFDFSIHPSGIVPQLQ